MCFNLFLQKKYTDSFLWCVTEGWISDFPGYALSLGCLLTVLVLFDYQTFLHQGILNSVSAWLHIQPALVHYLISWGLPQLKPYLPRTFSFNSTTISLWMHQYRDEHDSSHPTLFKFLHSTIGATCSLPPHHTRLPPQILPCTDHALHLSQLASQEKNNDFPSLPPPQPLTQQLWGRIYYYRSLSDLVRGYSKTDQWFLISVNGSEWLGRPNHSLSR